MIFSIYKALKTLRWLFLGWIASLLLCSATFADVIKPALIEVSAHTSGKVEVEIRASVEAIMTGINSQFKDTSQSPNGVEYDRFRVMTSQQLKKQFKRFYAKLSEEILLKIDNKDMPLSVKYVMIPPPGYTKVPRISVILMEATIPKTAQNLNFIYPLAYSQYAVRVRQVDKANEKWHWSSWQWIRKHGDLKPFSLGVLFQKPTTLSVIKDYIVAGFDHIIPKGLDHILFILGLFLFSSRFSPLLWQVTMFTLAHTITLGLSMSGWITLPARIVEPLIALSIVYVGIENLFMRDLKNSRLALIFGFGLLHGLGFASVLSDFGLPSDAFFTALLSFNIGVELGQLFILLLAYGLLAFWLKDKPRLYRQWVIVPGSLIISIIAFYWFLERLELF